MSLRCDDTLVQMYVEGALAPGERAVVGDHLRTCVACQRRAVAYKALFWDLAHPEPEAEPAIPPGLAALSDRLLGAWEQESAGQAAGRSTARTILDYSLLWLRVSPVAAASETVFARVGPAAGRTAPRLGQMARLGLGLGRRLLGRGQVRRR